MNKDTRSFIIIEPFMIDYKLPTTELFCYAIIHAFSKQQQGCFFGTQGYLAEQIKTSRQAVNKALASLADKGLIIKRTVSNRLEYLTVTDYIQPTGVQPQLTEGGATTVDRGATAVDKGATTVDKGATAVAHIIYNNITNTNLMYKKEINKERKELTFEGLISEYTDNPILREALVEFIKMRVFIKRKPTNCALKLIFKKIDRMAKTDDEKVELLNQSILNGWQDVYPLKNQQTTVRQDPQLKSQNPLDQLGEFLRNEQQSD